MSNGYVQVKFDDDAYSKAYTYVIPDYIDFDDVIVDRWAIVESATHWAKDFSPYKIVKVTAKCGFLPSHWHKATKSIVGVVDSKAYIAERDVRLAKEEIVENITDTLEKKNLLDLIDVADIIFLNYEDEEFDSWYRNNHQKIREVVGKLG